ncbi:hypothetical protein MKW92_016800, partial [Papaver armeniacum]
NCLFAFSVHFRCFLGNYTMKYHVKVFRRGKCACMTIFFLNVDSDCVTCNEFLL